MNRGKVGEERGGKETDRCPLTKTPLQDSVCSWATDCLTRFLIASMAVSASIGNGVVIVASE
jgi:hypothetical protein